MKNFTNMIKLLFLKKKYISRLCGYYGNPQEVRDHLQFMAKKYQFLSVFLKKDIDDFDKEVEKEYQNYIEGYQNYIEGIELSPKYATGCYNCPWGDGEGGCTIPTYCPNY
ncbi:MAG: hypothetical protein UHN47_03455 [Lachnospiraceae bacterium]|nr:hypothetical protein [Lachnospiraceae bacterium]